MAARVWLIKLKNKKIMLLFLSRNNNIIDNFNLLILPA